MTISSSTLKNVYTGNNSTTVFAYQFRLLKDTEILVTLDGVTQTLSSDYTVSGVGNLNGGDVTFTTAPGTGVSVALLQNPDFTQDIDYNELDAFPAESHEEALDRSAIRDQTIREVQQRTLRLPNTTSITDPEVGDLVANKLLVVNSAGTGIDMSTENFTDIQSDLSTVAGISSDVTTVSGISGNVTTVASNISDINTVSTNISSVNDAANNIPLANLTATTDPGASNDTTEGYQPGSKWVNTSLNKVFFCTDATTSAAVWADVEAALVETANIADSAVTTAKIADDNVTAAKIGSDVAIVPTGALLPYAGSSAPTGFLLCYGQDVNRTTYSDLFSAIGTVYGAGDGSTTFGLPDLRGRVVAGKDDMGGSSANRLTDQSGGLNGDTLGDTGGSETHTLTEAQMPSHTHTISAPADDFNGIGNLVTANNSTNPGNTETTNSTGGGGAHNNVQPTIILNYIIRT